jgi:hypothetical protein
MDQNKLKVLRELKYRISPTCKTCRHGDFPLGNFGYCAENTYEHAKHKETRFLSVHQDGFCEKYDRSESLVLDKFEEFFTGP